VSYNFLCVCVCVSSSFFRGIFLLLVCRFFWFQRLHRRTHTHISLTWYCSHI
jgi:hypothetical protein